MNIAASIVAVVLLWAAGRWLRPPAGNADMGVMSHSWMAEQRLARAGDPQR